MAANRRDQMEMSFETLLLRKLTGNAAGAPSHCYYERERRRTRQSDNLARKVIQVQNTERDCASILIGKHLVLGKR